MTQDRAANNGRPPDDNTPEHIPHLCALREVGLYWCPACLDERLRTHSVPEEPRTIWRRLRRVKSYSWGANPPWPASWQVRQLAAVLSHHQAMVYAALEDLIEETICRVIAEEVPDLVRAIIRQEVTGCVRQLVQEIVAKGGSRNGQAPKPPSR